jgi:DNA-binding FadR family transcriptional regulator
VYPAASADCAAELLQHHSDTAGVLTELRQLLEVASWSFRFQRRHENAVESMRQALPKVPAGVRPLWTDITDALAAQAPDAMS